MSKPPAFLIVAATLLLLGSPGASWSQQPPANVSGTNPPIEPPSLKMGDNGLAVELLQRTLNAQPGATPIDVDGDFGEATRAAGRREVPRRQLIGGGGCFAETMGRPSDGPGHTMESTDTRISHRGIVG